MATHYLVDLHKAPVLSSEINDVRFAANGETILGGNFIVRLPDGVSIGTVNPTSLTDLLTKKYAGLLAFYAGYTRITFEDFLDTSGINLATSVKIAAGDRLTTSLAVNSIFESNVVALTGPAPVQAAITWETFRVDTDSPISNRTSRTYVETIPSAVCTCQVSFNGGGTFLPATDGSLLNIPPPDQGTNFIIRITAVALFPVTVHLGSWAVVY
jgi:hypothetical protein